MALTQYQKKQVEQQIVDHKIAYENNQPAKVSLGDDELVFHVDKNVMLPDRMASRFLAEYLYINKDREDFFNNKIVLDMGCGCGIQGIVLAKYGAKKVIFTDLCKFDEIKIDFIKNTRKNAKKLIPKKNSSKLELVFLEGNLFEKVNENHLDLIVFNHPFFSADPKIEFPRNPVAYTMLDSGELIHKFFREARSKYPSAVIVMPYFHMAGPINDPKIQGLVEGYVPTRVLIFDVDVGLQNGLMFIYEFNLLENKKVNQTQYTRVGKVLKKGISLIDALKDKSTLKEWIEPIPTGDKELVKEVLIRRAILDVDWGEVFDEYDDEAKSMLFHHLVFSLLAKSIAKILPHPKKEEYAFLFVYYTEEGKRIQRGFYNCDGTENAELNIVYNQFKKKVIKENQFDLTWEILHELQGKKCPTFGLNLISDSSSSIEEEKIEGKICLCLDSLVGIKFKKKNDGELEIPDENSLKNSFILQNFLESRGKIFNKNSRNDFQTKFFNVYLEEMKHFVKNFKEIYLIPLLVDIAKSPIPVGSILVLSKSGISQDTVAKITNLVSEFLMPIRLSEFKTQVFMHSLFSAIGTIMARNISHNLGSHVLTSVATENTLESIHVKDTKHLIKYLQNRMDFVAQITTEFPRWTYSQWLRKQILNEFFKQNHLRRYIAISEDLNKQKINFRLRKSADGKQFDVLDQNNDFDQNDWLVSIPGGIVGNHAIYVILEDILRNSAKHSYSKLSQQDKEKTNLEMTIDIIDKPNDDFITIRIWDNVSNVGDTNYIDYLPDDSDYSIEGQSLPKQMNCKLSSGLLDEDAKLKKENWGLAEMKICIGYLQKQKVRRIGGEGRSNLQILQAIAVEDNEKKHLGYTFNLPKPKEFFILTNETGIDKIELKKFSIFVDQTMPADKDYEFMIIDESLINQETEEPFLMSWRELIDQIQNDSEPKEITIEKLKYSIESLPYRLFIVTNNSNEVFKSFSFLNKRVVPLCPNTFKELLKFLTKCDKTKFEEVKRNVEDFKLNLYSKWLAHLKNQRQNFSENNNLSLHLRLFFNNREQMTNMIENELFQDIVIETNIKQELLRRLGVSEDNLGTVNENQWYNNDILPDYLKKIFEVKNIEPQFYNNNTIVYSKHAQWNDNVDNGLYFESLTGSSIHYPILVSPPSDKYSRLKILCQLIENSLLRIAVCDERVCNSALLESTNYLGAVYFKQLLHSAGLVIIDKFRDWQKSRGNTETVLHDDGKVYIGTKETVVDVLVIHQGIIDKLGMTKQDSQKWINKLKEKIPFVVITSGRGKPSDVPENTKFLPFSSIESYLLSKPHHKFLLTQTIMSL